MYQKVLIRRDFLQSMSTRANGCRKQATMASQRSLTPTRDNEADICFKSDCFPPCPELLFVLSLNKKTFVSGFLVELLSVCHSMPESTAP